MIKLFTCQDNGPAPTSSHSSDRRSSGYFGAASDFDERVAAKFKLSRTDMRCLDILGRRGPMTAGQLADETG